METTATNPVSSARPSGFFKLYSAQVIYRVIFNNNPLSMTTVLLYHVVEIFIVIVDPPAFCFNFSTVGASATQTFLKYNSERN